VDSVQGAVDAAVVDEEDLEAIEAIEGRQS
jgi:hypothetical protein